MSTAQAGVGSGQVYALLADGTTVEIRPAGPDDFGAVKAMHEALSPDNTYMRFFNLSRTAAGTEARRICRDPSPDQVALLALSDGEAVGCASYVTAGRRAPGRPSDVAEIAFAVADHMHHRGIATLLLEHQGSDAQTREALFEQAGVIITRGYGELIEATALLATQPVPAGRTVAIVSSVGSAALLAADARLTPLTDIDADRLIRSVAPGRTYLRDLLLRVSRLADDLPEVTRLDLSPVIAGPDGAIVMAARITVAPYQPHDPFLRKLR